MIAHKKTRHQEWILAKGDEDWAVPPRHRNLALILFFLINEVIVFFKTILTMVNLCMRLKGVPEGEPEKFHRFMHHEPMKRPLKEGVNNYADSKTDQ